MIFGTDHIQLGRMAAERWHLPPDLGSIIGFHEHAAEIEDADLRDMARAVFLGSLATQQLDLAGGSGRHLNPPPVLQDLAEARDVPPEALVELIETTCPFTFENFQQAAVDEA